MVKIIKLAGSSFWVTWVSQDEENKKSSQRKGCSSQVAIPLPTLGPIWQGQIPLGAKKPPYPLKGAHNSLLNLNLHGETNWVPSTDLVQGHRIVRPLRIGGMVGIGGMNEDEE